MKSASRYALCLMILASIAAVQSFAAADDAPTVAGEVQQILDLGWKVSQDNYAAAGEHYERAKQMAPRDVRVPYAMALVSVQNRKFTEAADYFNESLKNGNSLLPIRRVKVWYNIYRKDKEAAKADIRELVQQLTADESMAGRTEYQDTSRMLGSVLGFYAGPGTGQMPAADLAALNEEIDGKLKGPLAAALAEGKTSTAAKYAELKDQLATAHQEAKDRNETKLSDDKQKTTAAQASASENRSRLEQQFAEFQDKHKEEVERKQRQVGTDQSQLANVNRIAGNLQDLLNAEKRKDSDKQNPNAMNQWDRQLTQAHDEQSRLSNEIRQFNGDLNAISAQAVAFQKEMKRQQSLEQGFGRKLKELDKTASESDTATQALESKANSIATYTGINLEQEKKRIIETYKGK